MSESLAALRRKAGINALLSPPGSNPKTTKSEKVGALTTVLHLAPGDMSGHEVCPKRSPGCTAACLMFAGNPAYMQNKTQARLKKTKLFFSDRDLFMNILALEIHAHLKLAESKDMEASIRLNGTSDLVWEKKSFKLLDWVGKKIGWADSLPRDRVNIIELFPDVQFYDYTKIPGRNPPSNYHLTFSLSEINMADAIKEAARGLNIAAVFPKKKVPSTFMGRDVIDGDDNDARYLDPQGVVVGLKVKGAKGLADTTGFVTA